MPSLRPLPDFPQLPWKSFGQQLTTLLEATANKLEREWPLRWNDLGKARSMLELLGRSLGNTFHTILVLSSDAPRYPIRPEDALSVPPLARTILDALFAVIYLFDDLPRRIVQYYKGGWRENREALERYRQRYANDPDSAEWLAGMERFMEEAADLYGLTRDERENFKKLPYWPTPGQMVRDNSISDERRERLGYLNDWFYRHLSAESHFSLPGLAMRSAALIQYDDSDLRDRYFAKQRSDQVLTSSVIALAFASEIEIECRFGLTERAQYIWTVLESHFGMAKDLYDPWYRSRLAA